MCIQGLGALIVSVIGYLHVVRKRTNVVQQLNLSHDNETTGAVNKDEEPTKNSSTKAEKSFVIEWAKMVWKLRSVYLSFFVHSFDIMTDVLVVIQWWFEESDGVNTDNIDTRFLSQLSIGVLAFHKIISSCAIYQSDASIARALLQFFDLLLFQEIYNAHKKITSNANDPTLRDSMTVYLCVSLFFCWDSHITFVLVFFTPILCLWICLYCLQLQLNQQCHLNIFVQWKVYLKACHKQYYKLFISRVLDSTKTAQFFNSSFCWYLLHNH